VSVPYGLVDAGRPVSRPPEDEAPPPGRGPRALAQELVGAPSVTWLMRLPLWRGVTVLAYHRVYEHGPVDPFQAGMPEPSAATFEAQLELITRHFEVVSPDAIDRDPDSRGRRVVLTFDDGYRDNYEVAFPILREFGVPATFFLTSGFLDSPRVAWWDELSWMTTESSRAVLEPGAWFDHPIPLDDDRRVALGELTGILKSLPSEHTEAFLDHCGAAAGTGRLDASAAADLWMTWEMAAEMRGAGMTFGGHTATHPVLARAKPEAKRREVEECARRLEDELGVSMRFFAYPVGMPTAFDEPTREILRHAGVKLAFSLYGGYLRPGRLDPYDVPRLSIGPRLTGFRAKLALPGQFGRW
jgi:peptidoglycan/xylan/chitin deacetylase (PgdA/CDA1 family)